VPERFELLESAMASVRQQTYGSVPHLIRIEEPDQFGTQHVTRQRNALLPAVETPWIAVLDDDDYFEPTYLERMAEAIEGWDGSDVESGPAVAYSYCHGHAHAEGPFDGARLRHENFIDGEACISLGWLMYAGGYPDLPDGKVEDWALWLKILKLGGEFVCVPERLRYHGRAGRNITG
jgi:glycosyltransferase involved in cell wall biosynthesis